MSKITQYISIPKEDPDKFVWLHDYHQGYVWYENLCTGYSRTARHTSMKDSIAQDKRQGHTLIIDPIEVDKYLMARELMR